MSDPKYKDVGPIAMLICPVCESRFAWGDVARMAVWGETVELASFFGRDWGLVNEYVDCFRPSMHSSVTAKRRLRLLQELKRLFLTSSIVYEGRQYRIDKGRVVVAVRAVCDAQKFGFRNHNYLKRVLVSGGAAMKKWWQHITNPLHMYCRLMNGGMSFERAKKAGRIYERGLEWIRRLMKRLKSS